jgi:hypothetical protein
MIRKRTKVQNDREVMRDCIGHPQRAAKPETCRKLVTLMPVLTDLLAPQSRCGKSDIRRSISVTMDVPQLLCVVVQFVAAWIFELVDVCAS